MFNNNFIKPSEVMVELIDKATSKSDLGPKDNGLIGDGYNVPSVWRTVVSNIKAPRNNGFTETATDKDFIGNHEIDKSENEKYDDLDEDPNFDRIGLRIANNTNVVDLKNGVLLVECTHPGWIQYLTFYRKFILRGLNKALPNLRIETIASRVKGTDINLSVTYEQAAKAARKKMIDKVEHDSKIIEKISPEQKKPDIFKLPPELQSKFDSITKDMLTNNKNT